MDWNASWLSHLNAAFPSQHPVFFLHFLLSRKMLCTTLCKHTQSSVHESRNRTFFRRGAASKRCTFLEQNSFRDKSDPYVGAFFFSLSKVLYACLLHSALNNVKLRETRLSRWLIGNMKRGHLLTELKTTRNSFFWVATFLSVGGHWRVVSNSRVSDLHVRKRERREERCPFMERVNNSPILDGIFKWQQGQLGYFRTAGSDSGFLNSILTIFTTAAAFLVPSCELGRHKALWKCRPWGPLGLFLSLSSLHSLRVTHA